MALDRLRTKTPTPTRHARLAQAQAQDRAHADHARVRKTPANDVAVRIAAHTPDRRAVAVREARSSFTNAQDGQNGRQQMTATATNTYTVNGVTLFIGDLYKLDGEALVHVANYQPPYMEHATR